MEDMFARDLVQSEAIDVERWQHRPWMSRVKEWSARFGAYWL
jgi:cardiolipin synthase